MLNIETKLLYVSICQNGKQFDNHSNDYGLH